MDAREEMLREAAALGNWMAVEQYLKAGVSTKSANALNGWTALHWASYRNHPRIVNMLLRHGADPNAVNNKGQTPFMLAKDKAVSSMLGGDGEAPGDSVDSTLPFTPNYLAHPSLIDSCSVPTPQDLQRPEEVSNQQTHSNPKSNLVVVTEKTDVEPSTSSLSPSAAPFVPTKTPVSVGAVSFSHESSIMPVQRPVEVVPSTHELLVYYGSERLPEKLIGCVHVSMTESIQSVLNTVIEELIMDRTLMLRIKREKSSDDGQADDLVQTGLVMSKRAEETALWRISTGGSVSVPIARRQWTSTTVSQWYPTSGTIKEPMALGIQL